MITKQAIDVIVFFVIIVINIKKTYETESEPNYYRYLQQYGYTPKVEGRRLFSIVAKSSYAEAIRKFQRLYKLPVRILL